jgi:hypothetical protein
MQAQFDKLRIQAFDAHLFIWGSGSERYFGPVNPTGIIARTIEGKTANYLILAEHAPAIHLGIGYEDFPPRTETVVFTDLDETFEFARLDSLSKTLAGIGASDTQDGTIKSLIKPSKPSRVTWRLLYPDPSIVFRELRPLPPEIDALCQILELGNRTQLRDQRVKALEKLQQVGKDLMPELHARLNPLIGQGEDMRMEYYIATTLANLGDEDYNIVREIGLHLAVASADGGGVWDQEDVVPIKCHAVRALSNVRQSDTVILLRRSLRDEDIDVRKAVIWALGALGEEDGRDDLESISNQPDGEETRSARAALELFGVANFDQIRTRSKELDHLAASRQVIPVNSIYVHRNGQQYGPYKLDQVKAWLVSRNLLLNDLVCYEGSSEWIQLSSIPGMMEQ